MAVSGTAVAVTAGGFVLLYSAVKNATISKTIRSFLAGEPLPATVGFPSGMLSGGSTGGYSGPPSGGSSGGNAYGIIQSFLSSRFNKAATSAIMGNMEVESEFSPTAYNAGENAIGLCQWEHGRRTGLQNFAAAHGSTETDVNMQLGWLMRELQTGFIHVYVQLKALPNTESGAALGAAIFDAQYEISSGDSRQTRIDNARRIFGSL
jgi:hypothetical protein